MADLDRFFVRDPGLGETLRRFKAAGKQLFLLTNSEVEYTAAVMGHLLRDEGAPLDEIFDLVICSARKPDFFVPQGKGRERAARPGAGAGQPPRQLPRGRRRFLPGVEARRLRRRDPLLRRPHLRRHPAQQEIGRLAHRHDRARTRDGRSSPCGACAGRSSVLEELEARLEDLELERDRLRNGGGPAAAAPAVFEAEVAEALQRRGALQRRISAGFNPYWGSLFKEGRAASRFGAQVKNFACIYTSRVSNFRAYPTDRFFVNPGERMAHES